jgi:hypothetical protein
MLSELEALRARLGRVRDHGDALHQLAFSKYLLDPKNKSVADNTYDLSQEINSIYWALSALIYREWFDLNKSINRPAPELFPYKD